LDGSPDWGAEEFEQAISMNAGDPNIYNAWGDALVHTNRPQEAISKYEGALNINPLLIGTRVELGDTFLKVGRIVDANNEYKTAVAINRNLPWVWVRWGNLLLRAGSPANSLVAFLRALRLDSSNKEANLGITSAIACSRGVTTSSNNSLVSACQSRRRIFSETHGKETRDGGIQPTPEIY
jgi:tetratricopeptide (TPR) repeat protein